MNRQILGILLSVAGCATTVQAQMDRVMTAPVPMQGPGVIGFHMEVNPDEDSVTKGQPYTAEIVTTHVQTLADGNRIVNSTTSHVYRDSEGRTRRENTLMLPGMEAGSNPAPKMVMINDPVTGVRYIVDDNLRVAHKIVVDTETAKVREKIESEMAKPREKRRTDRVYIQSGTFSTMGPGMGIAIPAMPAMRTRTEDEKTEDLGDRTIEGVSAHGTRLTSVLPAGSIGNERPITVWTEVWHSPELGIDMIKTHNDPWSGEITTKVTTLSRTEPDRSLFAPPADYRVTEDKPGKIRIKDLQKLLPPPPPQ